MSFLSKFVGSKKIKSVIGLDIGASSLKVVQLKREHGSVVLETYGELALGPYAGVEVGQATNLPADKIAENLRDLLREASVTSNVAGVSIPFSHSLLTLVELPRAKTDEEQKTMVDLEARKYIPVPVTEVQLDWFVVPDPQADEKAEPSPKVKVLIVAVQNDELQLLQQVTQGATIITDFYEIEIFSTIRSVVDEPVQPVMVIDIGASATKVYVVERGVVAFSHNIPQGGQDVTRTIANAHNLSMSAAEDMKKKFGFSQGAGYDRKTIELVYSRIFEDAKRVFTQYEGNNEKKISSIVLTGGGGVTKQLNDYAKSFFAVETKIADPFAKTQAPEFMRPVLQEIGPEFAVAVGLALRKLEEVG